MAIGYTTGDTRETASVFVCRNLLEERAHLFVFDPKVTREQMMIEFEYTTNTTEATVPGFKVQHSKQGGEEGKEG